MSSAAGGMGSGLGLGGGCISPLPSYSCWLVERFDPLSSPLRHAKCIPPPPWLMAVAEQESTGESVY